MTASRAPSQLGFAGRVTVRIARAAVEQMVFDQFPGLPAEDSDAVVGFVLRRLTILPCHLLAGVTVIAAACRLLLGVPGGAVALRWLAAHPVAVIGEFPRLVRSLAVAYVFETWPDRCADGSLRS